MTNYAQYIGKRVRVVAEFDAHEMSGRNRIDSGASTICGEDVVSVEIVKPEPKPGQVWRDCDNDLVFITGGAFSGTYTDGTVYPLSSLILTELVYDPEA